MPTGSTPGERTPGNAVAVRAASPRAHEVATRAGGPGATIGGVAEELGLAPATVRYYVRVVRADGRDLAELAARPTAGEVFEREDLELMSRGLRPNTKLALRRAWKRVLKWTGDHGYVEVPMPVPTCVKWIRANWTMGGRYGRPISPETVKQSLWAITKAHKVAMRPDGVRGYVTPVDSTEVQDALAGYIDDYMRAGHRPDMATPIAPDELVDMVATCDVRSPIGLRDALALCLGYDAGARAGELVPAPGGGPGVQWEDIDIRVAGLDRLNVDPARPADLPLRAAEDPADSDYLIIHIPFSKTDKEGYGDEVFVYAHPAPSAATCPVRLFLAWREVLAARDLPRRGPLLRRILTGGRPAKDGRPKSGVVTEHALDYDNLVRLFTRAVRAAGLTEVEGRRRHFVFHGMRAGAAEASAERGADTPELNRHFRWSQRGTTAQRYAARGLKRRQNPARRIWIERGR